MRFKAAVAALAVSVLSLGGAMLGASPASAAPANAVTPLYTNSYQCGGAMDTTQPTAGLVNMQLLSLTQLTVIIHIQGEANATYYPSVWATNLGPCASQRAGDLNPMTTNSNGVANERATVLVPGGGFYYVLAYSLTAPGSFLGTPAVAP
jgi:hypothetical protein